MFCAYSYRVYSAISASNLVAKMGVTLEADVLHLNAGRSGSGTGGGDSGDEEKGEDDELSAHGVPPKVI